MIYTLSNQFLTLEVNSKGAELTSVLDANHQERLWQADSAIWGRHAPILFPIVGRLKDDQCHIDGQNYSMGQHGFARDMEFHQVDVSDDALILELDANADTLSRYPYLFALQVEYRLINQQIQVQMHVINKDTNSIWFSIGAHPGFKIPFNDGEQYSDYQIQVQPSQTYDKVNLRSSYSDVHHLTQIDCSKPIPLNHDLFTNDAQILSLKHQTTTVTLINPKTTHGVSLTVHDAPYLGIWSSYPVMGDFVCLEPWWGLADDIYSDGDYKKKVAIQKLAINDTFTSRFEIKFS